MLSVRMIACGPTSLLRVGLLAFSEARASLMRSDTMQEFVRGLVLVRLTRLPSRLNQFRDLQQQSVASPETGCWHVLAGNDVVPKLGCRSNDSNDYVTPLTASLISVACPKVCRRNRQTELVHPDTKSFRLH